MEKNKGQGTIEYLVILAIIIVIGLITVSLISDFFSNGSQVGIKSNQARLQTGSIGVTEIVTTPDGNYILELSPNTTGTNTITKIEINDTNQDYSTNNQISIGENQLYQITTSENCTPGSYTTKTITITYISTNGITQKQVYENIQIPCENVNIDIAIINKGNNTDEQPILFYELNGTIYCPNAEINAEGIVNEVEYTKRNKEQITTQNAATTCTSGITDMSRLFEGEATFNGDITHWDTSTVTNMSRMFWGAHAFNQNLSNWDTANANDMSYMFASMNTFNQPLNDWNVYNVTNMEGMFSVATNFNQPLNNWNTDKLENMNYMFMDAYLFNQDLSGWNTENVTQFTNFDATASSWADINKPRFG